MQAGLKRFNYAVARRFVRLFARPTVNVAALGDRAPSPAIVYVLANRSLADIVLLELVAERHGLPSPFKPIDNFDEARRFFFLNRPAGWRRRHTMRTTSERMRRLEAKLAASEDATLLLVPVSMFWGRAANKDRSWTRALFSEGWAVSSRLRRFLSLLANGRDILVQFGDPLPWREIVRASRSESLATRRTARLLRVKFRNQKVAALGPDLSHRRSLVGQILTSAQVLRAIDEAVVGGAARERLERNARVAAYAIASDMSYPTIRLLERLLRWFWHRIYDGVRVTGVQNFERFAETHTLIYTPSHRSHIDYLVLSYVLFHRGFMLPHVAAGDNLDLPVVGRVLRGGGAFFMRRHFAGDAVYSAVFSEYVYQMFRRGHAMEYFVEGGRSRTGRLLPAHTGILRMTIDAHQRGLPRPVAFVPVYVGYEKIIEANTYLAELRGEAKERETVRGVLRSLRLARQSFGSVQVSFGRPIEIGGFLDACPDENPARALGTRILEGVNSCAFVNAVNLVALATLAAPRQALDESTLRAQIELCRELIERHPDERYGVTGTSVEEIVRHVEGLGLLDREHPTPARHTSDQQVEDTSTASKSDSSDSVARRSGRLGGREDRNSDILGHDPVTSVLMTWYRNNVLHVIAAPALIACLVANRRSIRRPVLRRLFDAIYPYIAGELMSPGSDSFGRWLKHLEEVGVVALRRGTAAAPSDPERRFQLRLLANTIMPMLERFYITLALLEGAGVGVLDHDGLLSECRATASRISKLYGFDSPEFADARLFTSFLDRLTENGVLTADATGRLCFDDRVSNILRAGRSVIAEELRQALRRTPAAR